MQSTTSPNCSWMFEHFSATPFCYHGLFLGTSVPYCRHSFAVARELVPSSALQAGRHGLENEDDHKTDGCWLSCGVLELDSTPSRAFVLAFEIAGHSKFVRAAFSLLSASGSAKPWLRVALPVDPEGFISHQHVRVHEVAIEKNTCVPLVEVDAWST